MNIPGIMNTPIYSGIITNYVCTAECRHCMFGSAPDCRKDFVSADMSELIACELSRAGTDSVHIGGGEPFMNFDALCTLIGALNRYGIGIDYIETNAFWCSDEDFIRRRLERLAELGVNTVMASVDPFHIEYVPLERPILLCRMLDKLGFGWFIWQERYLRKLSKLDISKTHTRGELEELLGEDYITDTAVEYGLGMNGRALSIAESIYGLHPAEELISDAPCRSLMKPHHCHLDLYGNAVPSGCSGIGIRMQDYLSGELDPSRYPVTSRLYTGGTAALWKFARERGFEPRPEGYPTKCALCYAIRSYLAGTEPSDELSPECFYLSMKKSIGY